jgi:hypothetical protein
MSAAKIAFVLWTTALLGCGNDRVPGGGGDDDDGFQADPPSVYVTKVKNILVGLPPTDAEIAQVAADPDALRGLIDGWMALPQYQQKMMVFFQLAFQQTQIAEVDFVELVPPRGLGNGRALPLLMQNVRESFARTVLQLVAEGKPFTDAFTTKRVMMTPALMNLYAYLDTRRVDNDGNITDLFRGQNPGLNVTLEAAQGPIPIGQSTDPTSANYLKFYNPDIVTQQYPNDPECEGLDPIVFPATATNIQNMLYGEIPPHQGPAGNCPNRPGGINGPQIKDTDFTDWRMVTIRQPGGGDARTTFFDLGKLRTATEIVVGTAHPGFFSTPAFFANWPTNASNQMRVTVNQALIVATGAQIDGTDPTTPGSTPGLDGVHADPATPCYGCHQLLDPTRSVLSATYSWFYYPQTDPALRAQPGLFAFQGVVAPMANIDDFANLLATHPLVAEAWAQKLCYYANSAPCDPADPELQRVVGLFKSSSFSWNTLIRELMSSPIITNRILTTTATTNGQIVSVSRRDHLCAALDNRLGFVDVCELDATISRRRMPSTIALIVSGLPSDGYGRGATAPVLPNEATLFYRAAIENICGEISAKTIDATPDPNQPGVKQWSSSDAGTAIADLVATVMALPASDPRAAQAKTILTDHFEAAKAAGESPTDALRSTFVVACLSPSFIGIGM